MICVLSSWCHCHLVISYSSKIQNGLPFWCRLTQVVLEKRPLNGCNSSISTLTLFVGSANNYKWPVPVFCKGFVLQTWLHLEKLQKRQVLKLSSSIFLSLVRFASSVFQLSDVYLIRWQESTWIRSQRFRKSFRSLPLAGKVIICLHQEKTAKSENDSTARDQVSDLRVCIW